MPFAEATDGLKLCFEDHGEGQPVIWLHEFGGEPASWDFQLAHFSKNFRCITYAARGFQPSKTPRAMEMYGQAQATADVAAVLDHLNIRQAHLVGTSMGSFTSLDFALEHPGRVLSLTLVGNSSGPRTDDERERYRRDWIGHEIREREKFGGRGAVGVLELDPAYQALQKNLPSVWRDYAKRLSAQSLTGALNILKTLHWNRRSIWADEARLRAITCPVLLVHGDEDYYLVAETNQYLEQVIPGASRTLFESTGHLVNIERADRFNRLLDDHLRSAG